MSDWKADLDAFSVWFKEKGGQVEPRQLTAFGIPIDSRYGKVWEIMSTNVRQ